VLKGRRVHTSDGLLGVALGVSAGGALRLQTDAGLQEIHSAEVSVRPFPVEDKSR
jgi:BirA family biotin operon repressor/biotin-[acetyl-CoA-carboxylase] ligase